MRKVVKRRIMGVTAVGLAGVIGFTSYYIGSLHGKINVLSSMSKTDTTNLDENSIKYIQDVAKRTATVEDIEAFLKDINDASALAVNTENLMFNYDEVQALKIGFNDWNKTDYYDIFGASYQLDGDDVEDYFKQAILKLRLYNVKTNTTPNIGVLIEDENSKQFLENYIVKNAIYNREKNFDKKQELAKDIIAQLKKDFIETDAYRKVNDGVVYAVLASYKDAYQIGWVNSEVKITDELEAILYDVERGLCDVVAEKFKNKIALLDQYQTNVVIAGEVETKDTYGSMKDSAIRRLVNDNAYPLVNYEFSYLDDQKDYYDNYNSIPYNSMKKSSSNTTKKSTGGSTTKSIGSKKVTDSGKNLAKDKLIEEVKKENPALVDDAKKQIKDIEEDLEEKNKQAKASAEELAAHWTKVYNETFELAKNRKPTPKLWGKEEIKIYGEEMVKIHNDAINKAILHADQYNAKKILEDKRIEKEQPKVEYEPVVNADNIAPVVKFGTNGNNSWVKSASTKVTVSDNVKLKSSSLKYRWTTSASTPSESSFSSSFTNGGTIYTPSKVTGTYYLWILGKDTSDNVVISRSNPFHLDNSISNPVVTPAPQTEVEVDIDLDVPVDGPLYDENGNIIKISSLSKNEMRIMALKMVEDACKEMYGPTKTYRA